MKTSEHIETLPVMEAFYTLQGEGFNSGRAAYFVRLGGCDVGCVWCDVKESWDVSAHPHFSIDNIVAQAEQHKGRMVVITGGEPLMHNLDHLTETLHSRGFYNCIETSGAYPLSGAWDWICVSPKKFKAPLPETLAHAHELKVVVYNKSDFAWAEQHAASVPASCKLYLQPEWSKFDTVMPLIVDYIKENPKWQTSLQTHKFMQIP